MSASAYPLDGITVLDFGQIYNGPYASFMLAMSGARVIKIEPPDGEPLRRRTIADGGSVPLAMLNANKEGVTLNLKHERGRPIREFCTYGNAAPWRWARRPDVYQSGAGLCLRLRLWLGGPKA